MSNQANRVYSYYNAKCGLGPQYFIDYLQGNVCPQKEFIGYYRLSISPTDSTDNDSQVNFVTDPSDPGTYRGISNRYMTESDYQTYNKNILTIVGYRTPSNTSLPESIRVPSLYNETVSINVEPYGVNFIQATANYIDPGSGFETTLPFVDYKVSIATGIFANLTNFRIIFYNDGNPPGYSGLGQVRKIVIT